MFPTQLRETKLAPDGSHFFEHTGDEPVLPWREWVRANLPTGKQGFTFEDIDGIAGIHGALAPQGSRFMLLEFKWMRTQLDRSQLITLQRLDRLLRRADPHAREYRGCYIVEWPRENPAPHVRVNYVHMLNAPDLRKFFLFELELPSYFQQVRT